MKLPDEFTATDPVSGLSFSLDSKSKNYLTVKSEEYGRRDGVRFEFARALIQYGRDAELTRFLSIPEVYRKDLEYDPEVDLILEIIQEVKGESCRQGSR